MTIEAVSVLPQLRLIQNAKVRNTSFDAIAALPKSVFISLTSLSFQMMDENCRKNVNYGVNG